MAKESGIGLTVAIDDSSGSARLIQNDITSLNFATPRGVIDSTGVDSSAMERILGLADFQATFNGIFNDGTAPSAHLTLKTVGTTSVTRTVTIVHSGQTLGGEECLITDYALTRSPDGALTWSAPALLQDGSLAGWS
jgi:hypothetical protein